MKYGDSILIKPNHLDRFRQEIKKQIPDARISTCKEGEKIRVLITKKTTIWRGIKRKILWIPMIFNPIIRVFNDVKETLLKIRNNNVKLLKKLTMKNLFNFLKRVDKNDKKSICGINIDSDMPLTIKKIKYQDVLKLKNTLSQLGVDQSFEVKKEWANAVRKLKKDHFKNYNLTIRKVSDDSYRVFRRA